MRNCNNGNNNGNGEDNDDNGDDACIGRGGIAGSGAQSPSGA
jgi:hypothetical protein